MFGSKPKPPVSIELPEDVDADLAQFAAGDLLLKDPPRLSKTILVDASNASEAKWRLNRAAESKRGIR